MKYEHGRLEQELNDVIEESETIKSLGEEREQLESQHGEIDDETAALRSHIGDLEREVVEQFNDHMVSVLETLGYANIERIWIERLTHETADTEFELHVVRETAGGAVYEDVVDNLSESEREVIGLTVALARYFVHEIHQIVPFMLLDSLEAIDSERIADFVAYFTGYAPCLVVALLPKDAATLPREYERIPAAELSG